MEHAFIADTDGSWFIGIDTGNNEQFVGYFITHPGQAMHVIQHRILIVS